MRGIVASWVIPGDGETVPIREGGVVVDEAGTVLAVGAAADVRARHPQARWEQCAAVLLPGLVNAHTHLELSGLRGQVPGGRGFALWVGAMLAARDALDAETRAAAIGAAVEELLRAGTVAVGEVTNTLDAVEALGRSPLVGRVFHEVYGFSRQAARASIEAAARRRGDIERWPARLTHALAPHTPYTAPPELLRDVAERARVEGVRTSIHLCEHAAERAYLHDGSGPIAAAFARAGVTPDWPAPGTDSVHYLLDLGVLDASMLCVHLTDAREPEIAAVAQAKAPVVLCPRSNLHIEVRLPPLAALLRAGIRPALGTDSLASCASLDVLDDARALQERFPTVPARTLIAMASGWGAAALGLADRLGTLAAGKAPGVVAFVHEGAAPEDPERFVLSRAVNRREILVPAAAHADAGLKARAA